MKISARGRLYKNATGQQVNSANINGLLDASRLKKERIWCMIQARFKGPEKRAAKGFSSDNIFVADKANPRKIDRSKGRCRNETPDHFGHF
jgi:hypothetical protein